MEDSRIRWWVLGSGLLVLVHTVVSLTAPESAALKAAGNTLQSALLLVATLAMWSNALWTTLPKVFTAYPSGALNDTTAWTSSRRPMAETHQ